MNVNIDIKISGDNGGLESWRVVLNQDELTNVIKSQGIKAGNAALDGFVEKFVTQFKTKLSAVLNR